MKLIYVSQKEAIQGDAYHYLNGLLSGKPDAFIIREKELSDEALYAFASPIVEMASFYDVPLFLRGSPTLAQALGIRNLQLSFNEALQTSISDSFQQIGVSVHHLDEVHALQTYKFSHLVYGHIFSSTCKPNLPPRGLDSLREIVQASSFPIYAIGGIQAHTLPFLTSIHIAGACLMSAAMTDLEPHTLTKRLRMLLATYRK